MDEGCYHHHPSVAGPIRDLPGRRPAALQLMARPARWWSKAGEGRAPEQVRRFDSVRPAGSGNLNRSLRRGRQRIGNVFMVRASVWMLLVRWRTAQCHLASCQPHIDPIGIHRWSVIHTVRRCRPIDMPSTTAAACHFIPPVLLSFTSSFVCVLSPRCDASSLTCCFKFSLLCLFSPVNTKLNVYGNSRLCCRFVSGFGNSRFLTKSTALSSTLSPVHVYRASRCSLPWRHYTKTLKAFSNDSWIRQMAAPCNNAWSEVWYVWHEPDAHRHASPRALSRVLFSNVTYLVLVLVLLIVSQYFKALLCCKCA